MNSYVRRLAKPLTLAVSLVLYLIFALLILPAHGERAAGYTPDGAYFDTLFFYPPASVYPLMESYGAEGRKAYIRARFGFDLVYPLVYTLFLLSAASFFLTRIQFRSSTKKLRTERLLILPLLALGFDYLENLSLVFLMTLFPARLIAVEYLASIFTSLKWLSVILSLGLVVVSAILWVLSRIRYRSQRQA